MESKGHSPDRVLRGLPLEIEHLRRRNSRIDWEDFCALLERLEELLGDDPRALEAVGEEHVPRAIFSWFPVVARTVLSVRDLYWLGARSYGGSIFRNVACEFEDISPTDVRETLTIAPPDADCPQYFHLMLGALRSGPRFLGLPNVDVKMERSPGRAAYTIHLPRSTLSLRARLFNRLRFSQPALREVIDELTLQQRELLGAYRKLSDAHAALKSEAGERERAETQLRQAHKLDAVGRMAAGIAHDFNNQLTVIMSYTETATRRTKQMLPALEDLAEIKNAARRAAKLTGDLLAFSRAKVARPSVVDLNDVVSEMQDMLRRLIGDDIDLVIRPSPNLGRVFMDRSQIEQVILNLVLNARDAMTEGGTLTIATENANVAAPSSHAIPELQPGAYVVVSVSDTGVGIAEPTRERMFEPFFTTKAAGNGTGLGLSIVWGIVRQNDGHIAVSTRPGLGSTLQLYLPRSESRLQPSSPAIPSPRSLEGTERVLVAEDDPEVRRAICRVLEESGYAVSEAPPGARAMEVDRHSGEPFDLLVTDVRMPHKGGPELARELRTLHPGLRVLFVSGYPSNELVDALGPGADFLGKPFSPDALRARVRALLDTDVSG
jgi:signal transduction histidine kinase